MTSNRSDMDKTLIYGEPDDEDTRDEIRALLVGRTVTKVDDAVLQLDDGRLLYLAGNQGWCCCPSGDYNLTELNDCPVNMITAVEFEDSPCMGDAPDGYYRIFVLAHDERFKLAEFEGTDGNGMYGTGYWIGVKS